MQLLRYANLALRFGLELCALAALGFWGFQAGRSMAAWPSAWWHLLRWDLEQLTLEAGAWFRGTLVSLAAL